nr:hypothetical protein [uncultured bacterium]
MGARFPRVVFQEDAEMLRSGGVLVQATEGHGEIKMDRHQLGIGPESFFVKANGLVELLAPGADGAEVGEGFRGGRVVFQVLAKILFGADEIAGFKSTPAAVQQILRNGGQEKTQEELSEHAGSIISGVA